MLRTKTNFNFSDKTDCELKWIETSTQFGLCIIQFSETITLIHNYYIRHSRDDRWGFCNLAAVCSWDVLISELRQQAPYLEFVSDQW